MNTRLAEWRDIERRILQAVFGIGSLVPILAGAAGVAVGPVMLGAGACSAIDLDSHFRYLSGLLLGIGLGYASAIPRIEVQATRVRLLTAIVVIGGIGRLASVLALGAISQSALAALVMELCVAPALTLWQRRVARAAGNHFSARDAIPPTSRSRGP